MSHRQRSRDSGFTNRRTSSRNPRSMARCHRTRVSLVRRLC